MNNGPLEGSQTYMSCDQWSTRALKLTHHMNNGPREGSQTYMLCDQWSTRGLSNMHMRTMVHSFIEHFKQGSNVIRLHVPHIRAPIWQTLFDLWYLSNPSTLCWLFSPKSNCHTADCKCHIVNTIFLSHNYQSANFGVWIFAGLVPAK